MTLKTLILSLILSVLPFSNTAAVVKVDAVLVVKSEAMLYLKSHRKIIRQYPVVFGANPKGHKQQEGDGRTPEGRYVLDYKNSDSHYYKSIHISYPNERDKRHAKLRGVNPGGEIMIHGQKKGWGGLSFMSQLLNWTNGCIAVTNPDMDAIWRLVKVGTPIEIRP